MSLENFKNRKIEWDTVNKNFEQSVQVISGDVNSRTVTIVITDIGQPIDLTGYSVKLIYKYIYNDNSGFIMLTPTNAQIGEFKLTIPTEMTLPGIIKSNLILLNESLEQVIVSKNIKFISDDSTVTDLAQEVNNKIDDFTKLLLENMPQVMRSELNDLHAQTESNTSNIELKANLTDMTSLQSAMTDLKNEVEAFGISPENLVTIKSLLDAIANSATDSEIAELINSVNILKNNISLMSNNGDYSPKANKTDLESLQSVVNNQSATISTKANKTDLDNLQTTVNSQGVAISTKANRTDLDNLQSEVDGLQSNFIFENIYQPTVSGAGGINISNGKVTGFGTQNYWYHAEYIVTPNLNLIFSFRKSNNSAVSGHIFATDSFDNIITSWEQGGGDIEILENYKITVPTGATKIYVQSFQNYPIVAKNLQYKSLLETIDEQNSELKSRIDDELKAYKELNNSNIYNFISRQGTLDSYPENSNKAVLNVKQNGFNYVRVCVAFTSDNVPVLIHDATINRVARNSDGSVISSAVNIADITLEQANAYDWGIVAGLNNKGMKIPLLSDFLKICSFKSIFPTLEFKPNTATDEQLKSIIDMVNKYGLVDKTYFTSNVDQVLLSVNSINPAINIGFIAHLNLNVKVDYAMQFKTNINKVRIDMFDTDTPTIDVINYASSKGVGIKAGSAYSIADIVKFASMGVTDIEVANVAFPATALNEYYDTL